MSSGYDYPFHHFHQPQVPTNGQQEPALVCDYCTQKILPGEEALNALYGVGGIGKRNQTPAVVPSKDIPEGEWDSHYACLPAFIVENFPEIADEICALRKEQQEESGESDQEPIFCANCDEKIEFE